MTWSRRTPEFTSTLPRNRSEPVPNTTRQPFSIVTTSRVSFNITAGRATGAIDRLPSAAISNTQIFDQNEFQAGEALMNAAWEWNDINEQRAKRRFDIKHYRAGQRKLIQVVL